jgi:hypothetical protein
METKTAAQHKYYKALSSDQKAQVLKTDAAKHKNIESLSLPNKKVKLSQSMQLHTKKTIWVASPGEKSKTHGNKNWLTSWTFDRRGEEKFHTDKVCCCYTLWKNWSG